MENDSKSQQYDATYITFKNRQRGFYPQHHTQTHTHTHTHTHTQCKVNTFLTVKSFSK
jgi:hypothetical protein